MPISLYEVLWIFTIYSFLGWCTEVAYAGIELKSFVNRGFLNGPCCPIYGVGVFSVIIVLYPLRDNLILLFLGSVLLTTLIEFFTGYILEKVFHNSWWNYGKNKFNIMGYVCLKFSIVWGLSCVFIIEILHPIIYVFIRYMPFVLGVILISIFMIIFFVDFVVTVATILNLNKRLESIDELSKKLHIMSDEIGESIFESVVEAVEIKDNFRDNHKELMEEFNLKKQSMVENMDYVKSAISMMNTKHFVKNGLETKEKLIQTIEDKKKEYIKLSEEYKKLMEQKEFGFKRLMNAFPNMNSLKNNEILSKMKFSYFKKPNFAKWIKDKEEYMDDKKD